MEPLTTLESLRRQLAVLSAIEESQAPFVSCHLNLGSIACRSGLEQRARALRASLPESARLDFDAAIAPIARYVNTQLRPDARGAAIFSRSVYGGAFFLAVQFAAPLPDALSAGPVPDLFHLMSVQDRYHRYAVILAMPRAVSVLEVDLGAASLVAWMRSPSIMLWAPAVDREERTRGQQVRFDESVALLKRVVGERRHTHLMLAGDPRLTAIYRRMLPASLRSILVGTIPAAEHHAIDDIVTATTSLFTDWEEEESQAIAARFVDAVRNNGPAAVGASACFDALRAKRAVLLLLSRGRLPEPGWRCAACSTMRIRPHAPTVCPQCGHANVWRTDATTELVRLAGQSDCAVELVEHCDPLMALGGVGCVLRH